MGTYLNSVNSDEPVAPNKKPLLALGLVGGLVLGSGTALNRPSQGPYLQRR